MNYRTINIGDKVKVVEDPDHVSYVVRQFAGRIGIIAEKLITKYGECRVLVAFDDGKNNDLWIVSQSGEYKTLERCTDI